LSCINGILPSAIKGRWTRKEEEKKRKKFGGKINRGKMPPFPKQDVDFCEEEKKRRGGPEAKVGKVPLVRKLGEGKKERVERKKKFPLQEETFGRIGRGGDHLRGRKKKESALTYEGLR